MIRHRDLLPGFAVLVVAISLSVWLAIVTRGTRYVPRAIQHVALQQNDGYRCCDKPPWHIDLEPSREAVFTLIAFDATASPAELRIAGARNAGPFVVSYDREDGAFTVFLPAGYLEHDKSYSFSADRPGADVPHVARWDFYVRPRP